MQTIPPPRWSTQPTEVEGIEGCQFLYEGKHVFYLVGQSKTFIGTICRLFNTLEITPGEFHDGYLPSQLYKERHELAELKLAVGNFTQSLNILVGR